MTPLIALTNALPLKVQFYKRGKPLEPQVLNPIALTFAVKRACYYWEHYYGHRTPTEDSALRQGAETTRGEAP